MELHTSERTIVPRTVIFRETGAHRSDPRETWVQQKQATEHLLMRMTGPDISYIWRLSPNKTSRSTVGANNDLSLLVSCGAVGLHPAHEEVDALVGQGGGPRSLHGLRLVLRQDALGVGDLVVPQLHHVVPGALPVEVDGLSGSDTGGSRLTRYDPINIKAWKERGMRC